MQGTFEELVERYLIWFRGIYSTLSFSRVLITERPWGRAESRREPVAVEDFADRFEEIVALGARSWVNLTALGLNGDILLLAVEYTPDRLPDSPRLTRDRISLNHSGLPTAVLKAIAGND